MSRELKLAQNTVSTHANFALRGSLHKTAQEQC